MRIRTWIRWSSRRLVPNARRRGPERFAFRWKAPRRIRSWSRGRTIGAGHEPNKDAHERVGDDETKLFSSRISIRRPQAGSRSPWTSSTPSPRGVPTPRCFVSSHPTPTACAHHGRTVVLDDCLVRGALGFSVCAAKAKAGASSLSPSREGTRRSTFDGGQVTRESNVRASAAAAAVLLGPRAAGARRVDRPRERSGSPSSRHLPGAPQTSRLRWRRPGQPRAPLRRCPTVGSPRAAPSHATSTGFGDVPRRRITVERAMRATTSARGRPERYVVERRPPPVRRRRRRQKMARGPRAATTGRARGRPDRPR